MKYQLVLQFPGDSLRNYDDLIALENELVASLAENAKVDGHDFGSGEMNIFIYTDQPEKTFESLKPIFKKRELFSIMSAAYREKTSENYARLWPVEFNKPFKIK